MKKEIEATFLSIDKDSMRAKLKKAGFGLKTPEYLMRRKTFDFSRIAPNRNKWGRVRQESDKVTVRNGSDQKRARLRDAALVCSPLRSIERHHVDSITRYTFYTL